MGCWEEGGFQVVGAELLVGVLGQDVAVGGEGFGVDAAVGGGGGVEGEVFGLDGLGAIVGGGDGGVDGAGGGEVAEVGGGEVGRGGRSRRGWRRLARGR